MSTLTSTLTLARTADRIIAGTSHLIAFKEHIDTWNKTHDPELYRVEPQLTNQPHLDAWLAGAAHYESFLIDGQCPSWANESCRVLASPYFPNGKNSKMIALVETPFPFRMRMVFTGKTFLR